MKSVALPGKRAIAMLAVAAAACSADGGTLGAGGRVGASIARFQEGIVVVNPDQGSVSFLDSGTLEQRGVIDVGGEPHALVVLGDPTYGVAEAREVAIATERGGEVVVVDGTRVVRRAHVCAGANGLATSGDGAEILVACEWEGAVVRLDAASLAVKSRYDGLVRPRAVAAAGNHVLVVEYTAGDVVDIAPDGTRTISSLVPKTAPYRPALTTMTANLGAALVVRGGEVHVVHVLENNTGDESLEKTAADYGSIADTSPKINPALTKLGSDEPVLYARYGAGNRVFNGPVAAATFRDRVLVVHASTNNVAVLGTGAPDERVVGSFDVGAGPHGIAVDEDLAVAWVDNAFDRSVSRIDLGKSFDATAPRFPAALTKTRPLPEPYSPAALAGRKLFYDATNVHVTPSAVVVCASCHPGGGEDGLVWFIHTPNIRLKRRRTPHLANARTGTAPYHWDGQFAHMGDLVRSTMTDLMAGDGLLVDVDAIGAYIDEIVKAPVPPAVDAAAAARGRTVFAGSAGCASCHGGDDLTDDALHAVLAPMSLSPDDLIEQSNTPALRGLFLRAPYLHDGRAKTLHDVLTRPDPHGTSAALGTPDLQDLETYLRSL